MKNKKTGVQNKPTEQGENRDVKFWGILIPIILVFIGGAFTFGRHFGKNESLLETQKCFDENRSLLIKIDSLQDIQRKCQDSEEPYTPFEYGSFGDNMHLGVGTSGGKTDWVKVANGEISMTYPYGENWGAVFITVGEATSQMERREYKNLSCYSFLVVELKGEEGKTVQIGIKDRQDPDNGSESKYTLTLKKDWNTYEIPLSVFRTADLTHLYVVTEFVFSNNAQTLHVRKIQFMNK